MACRPGPLPSATPQTKTCLWDPGTGGHFVTRGAASPWGLPLVGAQIYQATNGSLPQRANTRHEVTATG